MKTFILGYKEPNGKLVQFNTISEAEYESEEWCTVKADNLKAAKEKYEQTFEEHKNNDRISGAFSN